MVIEKQRRELIKELSQDLEPVRAPGRVVTGSIIWLILNFTLAIGLTRLTGPFRAGSFEQVQTHPQFLVESLIGVVTIVFLASAAFQSGIPTAKSIFKASLLSLGLLLSWILFYVVGFWGPAMAASMEGKREIYCNLTTLIIGIPSFIIGIFYLRRLWPLHGAWSGLLLGLAAGATPALIMQFACIYSTQHILQHHLLPGMALGPIGLIVGKYFLRT